MGLDGTITATVNDDIVEFTVTAANQGTNPIGLTFPTAQTVEIEVYPTDADADRTVWRYGDSKMFAQAVSEVTLAPGEELSIEATWHDPRTGDYRAIGRLTADDAIRATTEFSV